uniref:Family with sequence similarity 110 member A n=1 Tax=Oryzias melastigma TaxID=30732 RepID=A0A3B3D156_ORYME
MLQHTARQPTKAAIGAPAPRLRAKGQVGPQFYRQNPTTPRQSAVERLEADKAKYVKSQVALSKQQPIRPTELHKSKPVPAVRTTRTVPVNAAQTKVDGVQLDLEHLSNLISDVTAAAESPRKTPVKEKTEGAGGAAGAPTAGAIRRVDVVPQANPPPAAAFPPPSPAITRLSSTSSRKRPSLTRSKSDMSDRYSRAGTELERFFNLCGVDPDDLQELTGSNADIVSLARFRSVSAPGSECSGSRRGEVEEEDEDEAGKAAERVPYGVSVIERNARVIKWLYGLRQAKDNTTKSTNL